MSDLIVDTFNGPVKGKVYKTYYGNEVLAFQRIPYMKPPIGKLRFKDPEPVDSWTEVFDGTQDIGYFAQPNPVLKHCSGSETEIYINVFTKTVKPSKLQPVVISIHGGGFTSGSSSNDMFGPDNFLQDDIVFVSFNYRLAVLGFLSFDDPNLKVPGNAGLKDQTLAMKWIKKNAERFGGDPNNITLFGLSAGGASVHYHMISDMSRDLFNKAILMSGSVLNSWASVPNKKFAIRLAKKFGWTENESESNALEILQNVSAEELVMAQNSIITDEEKSERIYAAFVPTIEPYLSEQCFLPEPLVDMIPKQWSRNIPIVIGATTHEANMLWFLWENISSFPEGADYIGDLKYLIPFELGLDRNSAECRELAKQMKQFYFGDEELNFSDKETTLSNYLTLMTDKLFVYGIFANIKSRVSSGSRSAPTYLYRFNYSSKTFSYLKAMFQLTLEGVCHGDDINYVYSSSMYNTLDKNSSELIKVKQISSLWNNFVIAGNPNSPGIEPTVWTPIDPTDITVPFQCLDISEEFKMIDYPEHDRMMFWHAMFKNLLKF